MASALAEMCFGGNCGAAVKVPLGFAGRLDYWFFHETAGTFLLEVPDRCVHALWQHLHQSIAGTAYQIVGRVTKDPHIAVSYGNILFTVPTCELKAAWQQPMKEVFHS